MKNMRSVLAMMESNSWEGSVGGVAGEAEVKALGMVALWLSETNGSKAAAGREFARADGGKLQSSAMEGNGLLANGGIGWSELEKSNGGGWDLGLSSNHTSL